MAFGIYIHVPFCARRCPYCDFAFVVRKKPDFARYADALIQEIERAAPLPADSVYLGGGTPSLLPGEQLSRILAAVPRTPTARITLEANPEDVDRFAMFREAGVDRLSIGVQSLDDAALAMLGRNHTADAARQAVTAALTAGFQSVNADLIFGVPGQSLDSVLAQAKELAGMGVHHISAYGLTVHEGTLLAKAAREGRFTPASEGPEREQFLALDNLLRGEGFEHYEISNYARPGHRSAHNEIYWMGGAYRGFGPAAHSYAPQERRRFWNVRSLDKWLAAIEAGVTAIDEEELLTDAEAAIESLYLGLRRQEGIAAGRLAHVPEIVADALAGGILQHNGANLSFTPAGMAIADTFIERVL